MGGVNLVEKILCGEFSIQIFHSGQPGILAPSVGLFKIYWNKLGTSVRRGIPITHVPGVHTVTELLADEQDLVFSSTLVALEPGTPLLPREAIYDSVTVAGDLFSPWG